MMNSPIAGSSVKPLTPLPTDYKCGTERKVKPCVHVKERHLIMSLYLTKIISQYEPYIQYPAATMFLPLRMRSFIPTSSPSCCMFKLVSICLYLNFRLKEGATYNSKDAKDGSDRDTTVNIGGSIKRIKSNNVFSSLLRVLDHHSVFILFRHQ